MFTQRHIMSMPLSWLKKHIFQVRTSREAPKSKSGLIVKSFRRLSHPKTEGPIEKHPVGRSVTEEKRDGTHIYKPNCLENHVADLVRCPEDLRKAKEVEKSIHHNDDSATVQLLIRIICLREISSVYLRSSIELVCDESVQNMEDKPWKNEGLKKLEDLKRRDLARQRQEWDAMVSTQKSHWA